MKIIDGKNATMGRLASYAAKESLRGEEIIILNCDEVVISGNKEDIQKKLEQKRRRVGSGQRGPKHHKDSAKIVKRAIRGMLPEHRTGRGKEAYKKIKCYKDTPKEFQEAKKINPGKEKRGKISRIKEFLK